MKIILSRKGFDSGSGGVPSPIFPDGQLLSPYQNVKKGTDYPAILFFTGASDTRVDPMNARKMAAEMQADSASGRPILLHYGMNAGHSAGVGVQQQIQDYADQMTFLWTETGPVGAQK